MDWRADGYILANQKYGETAAIIDVFTREQGRYCGLVHGGIGRRMRPILQPGNQVHLHWRARLAEHLGTFRVESLSSRAALLMDTRLSLAALNGLCALIHASIPEREAYPVLFDAFEVLLSHLDQPDIWPPLFIRWELELLRSLGYGLDLSCCGVTGQTDNLSHVLPHSGCAVTRHIAMDNESELLRLPGFLRITVDSSHTMHEISPQDIIDGFELTGYFLENRVQVLMNKSLPYARAQMLACLNQQTDK